MKEDDKTRRLSPCLLQIKQWGNFGKIERFQAYFDDMISLNSPFLVKYFSDSFKRLSKS